MDLSKEKDYIFDFKLAKILGLYQILDSKTTKIYGYNIYHIGIMILGLFSFIITMINLICLYRLTNDITAFMYYSGILINFLLSCYKIINILYSSKDLWICMMDITNCNFISYKHYNRNVFKNWRSTTILVLYIYAILTIVVIIVWTVTTIVMNTRVITIRNCNGSYSKLRMSFFNSFFMVPDDMYNDHYVIFFIMDLILFISFDYFIAIFVNIIIIMCFAFSCQLEIIADGIASLGYQCLQENSNINNVIQSPKNCDVYDDLKMILIDHQKVMKKLNDYFNIIRSMVLPQICVASYTHIFIWFVIVSNFSGENNGDTILSLKLLVALPLASVQLIMTCFLFGNINGKIHTIVYSLYSSNWTDMDMKSKNLVLFAMMMNNSTQPKIKFTRTQIVNLEMFAIEMRICYSIFSMLINYYKNLKNQNIF